MESHTASRIEAAANRRESFVKQEEKRRLSILKEKLVKEEKAQKIKQEKIQERKERAAASLEDVNVVLSRAETARSSTTTLENLHDKVERAEKLRKEKLEEKREKARVSLDDVQAILARASIIVGRRTSASNIDRLEEKDKKAAAIRNQKLEEKRGQARKSLTDVSAALSRASVVQSARSSIAKLNKLSEKEEKATQLKNNSIEQKRESARKSLYDVEKTRAHAQVQEAIRKSVARQEKKELELKIDLARDRRASQVELVKEKQAFLQDAKYASSATLQDEYLQEIDA
ncbi:UNVERIFIED_CONTAM: hypothetical protein HDU68_001985 [Siphonaria sp. JEL0065]|nr:hypothetical protein HDU68_001985 [Siphonaria sp. JEL0065]